MKEKKGCIITFPTVHQALRAEKILTQYKFMVTVLPVPREISSDCGIAIKFSGEDETRIKTILDDSNVKIEGIHYLKGKKVEEEGQN